MSIVHIVLVASLPAFAMAKDSSPFCPPGFIRNATGSCVCWHHHLKGILQCSQDNSVAKIAKGYCMTFHAEDNSTIVGKCPFQEVSSFEHNDDVYITLPDSIDELEAELCGGYHRRGLLCSNCEEFYGPPVSLSMDCVPCNNVFGHFGHFVYATIQFVIATIVYLLIMLFNVRLTKSPMNCFILFSQVIVNMMKYDTALYARLLYAISKSSILEIFTKLVISFYGFWNLDFFPVILPPFCIAPSLKGIHLFLLQYLVALYPLVLTAVIYCLVRLYIRHFKPVVLAWRAVKYCLRPKFCCGFRWFLAKISKQDLANSFASFLLLSYSKIIFISVSFFLPITVYTVSGNATPTETVLYYDPRIQFLGRKHWPHAIVALSIFLLFVVVPLLLLFLHPLCTHRCTCVKYSSHSVRFFAESFQGWFKDGTERGTKDYRLISCVSPLVRIIFGLLISLVYVFGDPWSGLFASRWILVGLMFTSTSLLFSIARPYKLEYMNSLEMLLYLLLGVLSFVTSHWTGIYFILLLSPIPMLVLVGCALYWILKKLRVCCRACCSKYVLLNRYRNSGGDENSLPECAHAEHSLPHRFLNPDLYGNRPSGQLNNFPPLLNQTSQDSYGAI